MRYILTYCILILGIGSVLAADPIVSVSAQDSTIACGTPDANVLLTQWYESGAGALATDPDGSDVFIVGFPSLDSILTVWEDSSVDFCGNNMSVTVIYTAIDSDGETSPAGEATFRTIDETNPVIDQIPTFITYECQEGIQDTLASWIQTRGGATASDECSDVEWTTFIWNDTEGNSGIGNISTGPYPTILGSCEYSYNVSFIVVDDCLNQRAATGRFTIIDDTPPIIENLPDSITVSCDNIPEVSTITATDFCDPGVNITVSDDSDQTGSETECSFYNYTITRTIEATDACGNMSADAIIISVADLSAPVVSGEDTVYISCEAFDTGDTILIAAIDDCSEVVITKTDTPSTLGCLQEIDRTYTATDACGNMVTYDQHIVVEDVTDPLLVIEPTNRFIPCTTTDAEAAFDDWVTEVLSSTIIDGCSSAQIFAAVPNSYNSDDPSTFPGEPVGTLDLVRCPSDRPGLARYETVNFVVHDECDNVTVYSAIFGIEDEQPPTISSCIENIELVLADNNCTADLVIPSLSIEENCTGDISAVLVLGSELNYALSTTESTIISEVPQGSYDAVLQITDCAGNVSDCTFSVNILDEEYPMISNCPVSSTIAAPDGECEVDFVLGADISVSDNCSLTKIYQQKKPGSLPNELLTFSGNDPSAGNETFVFTDVEPILFNTAAVRLAVRLTANQESGFYIVFDDSGNELGDTDGAINCTSSNIAIDIPVTDFNSMVSDEGEVTISFISSGTIRPCDELSSNNTDEISRLSAVLSYTDAEVLYTIAGATESGPSPLTSSESVSLSAGENFISYTAQDQSGNADTCTYTINVTDESAPTAICKNAILRIPPDGEQDVTIDPALIDDGSSDACSDVTLSTRPEIFDCSQVGTEIEVILIATDVSGNKDSCTSLVKIEPMDLQPSFSAGICQDDTLRLFANAPLPTTPNTYTYQWTGPNFSSTDASPFILGATTANNGLYMVTVTGFNDCSAEGSVQVNISPLTTPDLSADREIICLGEELVLTTTVFTGNITYTWYEGSFPDGVQVGESSVASLIIQPTVGPHFYYVIASSDNCESTPSSVLSMEVLETPIATVDDNFINVCEGSTITLGTSVFGTGYDYLWLGPNGFTSDKPRPESIINITAADAGEYSLVITAGDICTSDTAVTRVNIFDKPTTPIITSGETFCEGSTVSLTVNNISNADLYTWLLNGEVFTTETDNSLVIPSAQANISGSWQVIATNGICASDTSATQSIFIEDLQDISISNNGPGCVGDSLQLFVTFIAGATYAWTGPDGFNSDRQNPKILAIAGEYQVDIITGTNCEATASTSVVVNTAPVITALSNNSQPCMDGETNIVFFPTVVPANNNFTYQWNGPNGFISGDVNPTLTNPTETVNGAYSLTVINDNCPSTAVETIVDITVVPSNPAVILPGAACVGSEVIISSSTTGPGYSYVWTTPSSTITTDVPDLTLENITNTDAGEYTVTIISGECESETSVAAFLEVTSQPSAPTFSTNSPVCNGESLILAVNNPLTGGTYIWSGNQGNTIGTGDTLIINSANSSVSGTYQVTLDIEGCQSTLSAGQEIEVSEEVLTPAAEQELYSICVGISQQLEICVDATTAEPGATYSMSNVNTGLEIGTSNSICFTLDDLSVFDQGTNFVTIQATSGDCSSAVSEQFRVELSDIPSIAANIVNENTSICQGEELQLTAQNGPPLVDVEWSSIGGDISFSNSSSQSVIIDDLSAGDNKIILSYSQNACIDYSRDTVTVRLQEAPEANDDEFENELRATIELEILDNDILPPTYTLEIVDDPFIGTARVDGDVIIYEPDDNLSGAVQIIYEVCANNCPDLCSTAIAVITVGDTDECIAPTIITPNGDNVNDNFVVTCLSNSQYSDNELTIFNQWGDEVFSAQGYQNNWGGTFGSKPLAAGTYFYILDLGDGTEPIHSFLIIQK